MAHPPKIVDHGLLPRHNDRKSKGDIVLIEAVEQHLKRLLGEPLGVIGDKKPRHVHVDLFVVPPTPTRPVLVVTTSGMAERPLLSSVGKRIWSELVLVLPESWPTALAELQQPERCWPLTLLRWLAHFPHETGVGYQVGDNVGPIPQASPPPSRLAEAAMLLDQPFLPPLAMVGREVRFLAVCPIFPEELAWVQREGSDALLRAFSANDAEPLLVDPSRPSFAPTGG